MTIGGASRVRGMVASILVGVLTIVGLTSIGVMSAAAADSDTIASLVNQARAANGQAGLLRNGQLDAVAVGWANQMAANGAMAHNPNLVSQVPAGWSALGENVAQGQPSAPAMHTAWMNSPGHRANILGDFTDIGVAFVAAAGTTWGVEVFAKYPGHAAAPAAPPAAPAAPAAPPAAPAAPPAAPAAPPVAPAAPPAAPAAPAAPPAAPAAPPAAAQVPGADAGAAIAPEPTPSPSASPRATSPTSRHPDPSPGSAEITLVATKSPDPNAAGATFPIGYLIGILLVVVGVAGGIYGRLLRRRGRRPFTS